MRADLIGQRFGRLTVKSFAGQFAAGSKWNCVCDCGGTSATLITKLRTGRTISCGCAKLEKFVDRNTRHGKARTPTFNIWAKMRRRCEAPADPAYPDYGGRGIKVCARWMVGESGMHPFECFLADMGEKPSPLHSTDRIDNDRGYEPGNCRWATAREQARNRRSNRMVFVRGVEMPVAQACELLGLDHNFVNARLQHGFSWERAISQPKRVRA